jgi:predicted RND superfamily exporter protein
MVVSGIAINAAVLCISGLKQIQSNKLKSLNLYLIIRNKIPSLLSTTMATFSGSLPFLLLKEAANSFITLLSLITSIGVIVSFVSSITIVPCLYIIIYSRDKKYKLF